MKTNIADATTITLCGCDRAEDNDCTVRATAKCLDITYAEAHARLAALGRKSRKGFKFRDAAATALGLEIAPEFACRTLVKVLPELQGRFIVRVRNHVFAVVDGWIFDAQVNLPGKRVRMVYRKP